MAGDGGHEVRDRFGVLALVEHRRHLPETACATFGDGVQHERLAARFGGDLCTDPHIEVGTDASYGIGAIERVTDGAGLREQHAAVLLLGVEVDPADRIARLVGAIVGKHERRDDQPKANATTTIAITKRSLAFDSVCSAERAPRGPPRIATKKTARPMSTQKTITPISIGSARYMRLRFGAHPPATYPLNP